MTEQGVITQLAEKCLDETGQEAVETLLLDGQTERAKIYILGAIDSLWTKKQITDNEAAEAYRVLGVNPEKASKVRQSSPHWK